MLDASRFFRKTAELLRRAPAARSKALRVLVFEAAKKVDAAAPRDTNRLAAGFAQAFNQATGGEPGRIGVPEIVPSRRSKTIVRQLEGQVRRFQREVAGWERFKARYEREGRTKQPYYRKILKMLDENKKSTAAWLLKRSLEELAKYAPDSLLIYNQRGRNLKLTVRTKVYGGHGAFYERKDLSLANMVHLEPHARIQDRKRRLMQSGFAKSRSQGLRRAKRATLLELQRGVGGDTVRVS